MDQSRRIRSVSFSLLSAFLLWHAVGVSIVGPSADSYLRQSLMSFYQDYLAVFHLDRSWPFYAPDPFRGSILRYQTVNAVGETHTYPLTEARQKFNHAYFRYTNFYAYLFSNPQYSKKRGYDRSVARYLCEQHAGSDVRAINFVLLNQKRFTYQDYQQGKRPLDEEFLRKTMFGPYRCKSS